MAKHRATPNRCKRTFVGRGGIVSSLINKAIDAIPIELHLPGGYAFCGVGTKLEKRLARGDVGINGLDKACKIHDIEYSKFSDNANRRRADKDLAERAWQRFKASDSSLGEKAAAWAVTTAMKAKTAIGGGKKQKKKSRKTKCGCKTGNGLYLRPYKGNGTQTKKKKKKIYKKKKRQYQ